MLATSFTPKKNLGFTLFFISIFHSRDNGISIQILMYQLYSELFMFFVIIVVFSLPFEKGILFTRLIGVLNTFVIFVIQPLFYLNGDSNFRNRVLNVGLCKALKMELFQNISWVTRSLFYKQWFISNDFETSQFLKTIKQQTSLLLKN